MRNEPVEVLEHAGLIVKVLQDETEENPRDWDNLSKFVFFHKRYDLPNELNLDINQFSSGDEIGKHLREELGAEIVVPVYMYDHSGISISRHYRYPYDDPWDAGQVGFAVVLSSDILKEYSVEHITEIIRHKALAVLDSEIATYNAYLTGDVYGYVVETPDGEYVSSCWGYYGDDEVSGFKVAKSDGQASAEWWAAEHERLAKELAAKVEASFAV